MATKREHAVAVLDALESKVRLKSKTVLAAVIAVVFLLAVAYFTMWQYAIGGALSTISYELLVSNLDLQIRIIFVINMLIWGLFTWASMRWFVFGYDD